MRRTGREGWAIVAVPVLQFVALGLAALLIVGLAVSLASRRLGQREAIANARSEAQVKGQALVEPLLRDDLLDGAPGAVASIDEVVRREILDDTLVRVKIWRGDGTVLYSDEAALIGASYALGADERQALGTGMIEAEVSDLTRPENRFEQAQGKLLEVYLPLRTPSGTAVLFESYFRYDTVSASGQRIWRSFAPVTLGSLVVLGLIQIPLAASLALRLRERHLEREALLTRALDAADRERRRIAQDLHDGVVQDLAGVSFVLSAAGRRSAPASASELQDAATTVRASIEALRTLLIDIYPPDLVTDGLTAALVDLVDRQAGERVAITLDTAGLDDAAVGAEGAELVYRVVQEALRNAVAHAGAGRITVRASSTEAAVRAEVADDGGGFDPTAPTASAGHFGLRGLTALAAAAGATLVVGSAPGQGTTVSVELPLPERAVSA